MKVSTNGWFSRMVFTVIAGLLCTGSLAFAYVTDSSSYFPLNYFAFLPPAVGGSFTDSVFGTAVKRISNTTTATNNASGGPLLFIGNEYSTMSPFNSDSTRLILLHFSYFGLYDSQGGYVRDLPFSVYASSEPRWSRTDPNVLYYVNANQLKKLDVSTMVSTIVHTFSEYGTISGKGESDISFDGDHFVFAGDNRYVFTYEISTDRKSSVFDTAGNGFDSLYISPNNLVTITWYQQGASRFSGVELFDRNMSYVRQVMRAGGHMDITRDVNGDDVLVWANAADPVPVCNNGVVKVRLLDGQQTCLVTMDWSLALHVSATDNGWAFVDTYAPADPSPLSGWPRLTNEILQVKLDGSEVRRLVHHRSRPANSYGYTPRVAANRDGSRIVFNSNFGLQSILGLGTEYSDTYMVSLGVPAPAPAPAPAPSPAPAPATPTRYEQNNSAVVLSGSWSPNSGGFNSGGSAALSMDAGARATFTFTGVGASWIAYRDEWSGIARILLDGAFLTEVDTYATPATAQASMYTLNGLASGPHVLTVEATGRSNPSSGGTWVWVDAFDALSAAPAPTPIPTPAPAPLPQPPPSQTVRIEQNDPLVRYSGAWTVNNLSIHSGGRAVLAMDNTSRATVTFTGTGISWIGYRDEWSGKAKVYIDGVLINTVDTYLTPAKAQAVIYSVKNLVPGTHSLVIAVAGQKNNSSRSSWVWIDAFDITR